jgi:hypothetical protein
MLQPVDPIPRGAIEDPRFFAGEHEVELQPHDIERRMNPLTEPGPPAAG